MTSDPDRLHTCRTACPAADRLLGTSVSVISSLALVCPDLRILTCSGRRGRPCDPVEIDPAQVTGHVRLTGSVHLPRRRPGRAGRPRPGRAGRQHAGPGRRDRIRQDHPRLADRRLYDPQRSIRIDGTDIRDMRLTDLAAIVGVVSQETYLLHTPCGRTLRTPGRRPRRGDRGRRPRRPDPRPDRRVPDGYDTMVGSAGNRFSGGEKQRMRDGPDPAARPGAPRA